MSKNNTCSGENWGFAWLTSDEAAEKLAVSKKWLLTVGIRKYGIPYRKFGSLYRFIAEELDAFPGFGKKLNETSRNPDPNEKGMKENVKWLTVRQAARKLKVSEWWLKSIGIPKYGIPFKPWGETYRFLVLDLDRLAGSPTKTAHNQMEQNHA